MIIYIHYKTYSVKLFIDSITTECDVTFWISNKHLPIQ